MPSAVSRQSLQTFAGMGAESGFLIRGPRSSPRIDCSFPSADPPQHQSLATELVSPAMALRANVGGMLFAGRMPAASDAHILQTKNT